MEAPSCEQDSKVLLLPTVSTAAHTDPLLLFSAVHYKSPRCIRSITALRGELKLTQTIPLKGNSVKSLTVVYIGLKWDITQMWGSCIIICVFVVMGMRRE